MEEWTWLSLTQLLSTTFTCFIPYMQAHIQFCVSHQDGNRARSLKLAGGTARVLYGARRSFTCLGHYVRPGGEKLCPGIRGTLRKGGFNPTNRPENPQPVIQLSLLKHYLVCFYSRSHTYKPSQCICMNNRNNPDEDLALFYFSMNQIFKWVDWKDR